MEAGHFSDTRQQLANQSQAATTLILEAISRVKTNVIGLQPTKTRAELDSSTVLNIWNKYFTSITR